MRLIEADPERLQLPDVRRPERMPSLPEWVASRVALLKRQTQPDLTGKWREVMTLPANLTLNQVEREKIMSHAGQLTALCEPTPETDPRAEAETLVILTNMMWTLSATRQNEESVEARGLAYLAALDDIPPWSIAAAVRRWHRGDCGSNERGEPYDYHWCPAPAELRRIAMAELWRIKGRSVALTDLLAAESRIEFSDEHCAAMRARLAQVIPRNIPLVGKDGSGGTSKEKSASGATVGRDQASARPAA